MVDVTLRELFGEIEKMKDLADKLGIYDHEWDTFKETIPLSMQEARLAQRCIRSYMDILLDQKVKAGDY